MAATNSTSLPIAVLSRSYPSRDLTELIAGFAAIMAVLWLPTREQLIVGPVVLLAPLFLVLWRRTTVNHLGLSWSQFTAGFWILPAAVALSLISVLLATSAGTLHSLHDPNLAHCGAYVLWTIYQQFLLQDFFMPRLTRALTSNAAIAAAAILFAVAHLPNLPLTLATLVWGVVSCALFRRYRSLYVIGLAQGLLGLCFAICIPDALHHNMRVGLGYFHYHAQHAGYPGSAIQ